MDGGGKRGNVRSTKFEGFHRIENNGMAWSEGFPRKFTGIDLELNVGDFFDHISKAIGKEMGFSAIYSRALGKFNQINVKVFVDDKVSTDHGKKSRGSGEAVGTAFESKPHLASHLDFEGIINPVVRGNLVLGEIFLKFGEFPSHGFGDRIKVGMLFLDADV